jgi:penicillin V acylase-like amidase (Ntn superfamily)
MTITIDEYQLEDISRAHEVHVGVLIPFAIARLAPNQRQREAYLTVILRDAENRETQHQLRLHWSAKSIPEQPLAVPEKVITELAACGVACAVLARYTSLSISLMTNEGDRFDYWVSDGSNDYGLEISGTMTGETEYRVRLKARQLGANPHRVGGYVVVVNFATKEVICAFHYFEGDKK